MKTNYKVASSFWLLLLLQSKQALASSAIPWWDEIPTLQPYIPHQYIAAPPIQPANHRFNNIPKIQPIAFHPYPKTKIQHARFSYPASAIVKAPTRQPDCNSPYAGSLSSHCLLQKHSSHEGLAQTLKFLSRVNAQQTVGKSWAGVSNATLLQTAKSLINLKNSPTPSLLNEQFSLRKVHSNYSGHAKYTGYFTPVVNISRTPSEEYRYPIYAKPPYPGKYSHAQIHNGALRGKGLEIAWTNDRVNLFFAHIQGSAIARYPDGKQAYLNYAGNNYHPYQSIGRYLQKRGYIQEGLSNENMRQWLHQNPHKMNEVLHQNPRYVFFHLTSQTPRTSTGNSVIPGHTVAVDDRYIPLGSVLLAKIPRIDAKGQQLGHDWRLLFAQDRGHAIRGPGRIDLYVGAGRQAEQQTYKMTGFHDTYLLIRKPEYVKKHLTGL